MNRNPHCTYIPNEKRWTCQFYHVKQLKENVYLGGNIKGRFLSLISLKCVSFCRDEHTDWLWSGTWAKDSRSSSESLPEVKRLGERRTDFGSCEGEKRARVEAHSSGGRGGAAAGRCVESWWLMIDLEPAICYFLRTRQGIIKTSTRMWSKSCGQR